MDPRVPAPEEWRFWQGQDEDAMIKLTRLNESEVVVNAEMIEFVEAIQDTILSLVSGKKIMVSESVDEVIERVSVYRRRCNEPPLSSP